MTKEELKQRYSMKEIVEQYGFRPNRAGFICCPFHTGDRDASLKIYEKDFHCFGCGANRDIFDFVQGMDGVSFREAFLSLGGTYRQEKPGSFSQRMARYRREKAKEQRKKELAVRCLSVAQQFLYCCAVAWWLIFGKKIRKQRKQHGKKICQSFPLKQNC